MSLSHCKDLYDLEIPDVSVWTQLTLPGQAWRMLQYKLKIKLQKPHISSRILNMLFGITSIKVATGEGGAAILEQTQHFHKEKTLAK